MSLRNEDGALSGLDLVLGLLIIVLLFGLSLLIAL